MKKDEKEYLTLGEVAEILGINKTTLRHYNREGLISFERDEENNYRYYHKNQIDNFKVRLNLRKVGFSIEKIKEIKQYMIGKKYDLVLEIVNKRLNEYLEEIKEIQKYRNFRRKQKIYGIFK